MENIIKNNIIKYVIDGSYKFNSMYISFSIIDEDLFVLHFFNPNKDKIEINENNKVFFEKLTHMLFNKNERQKGCFNHQQSENSVLYDSALDVVLNHFLGIEYAFVLVETKNMNPISISCCEKNYIYNVCTNFENRKQGNMEKLLNHFFDLVKKDKLKNGKHNEILLDVVFVNPDYQSVREYYENKYNFVFFRDESNKTILKKII